MTDEARNALALQIAENLESAFRGDLYGVVWDTRRAVEVIAEALPDMHPAAANEMIQRLSEAIAPGESLTDDTLVVLAEDGREALQHLGAIQETETELDAANETIKRLRATIAASDVIKASDTHVTTCPECGTRCYMTQDAPCASIQVCPACNWNERVCLPCVKLAAALQEENKQLRVASVEFQANEAMAYNLAYDLEAIVDRLPKTADGVPVTPGMEVYRTDLTGHTQRYITATIVMDCDDPTRWMYIHEGEMYSTSEDAEIAKKGDYENTTEDSQQTHRP